MIFLVKFGEIPPSCLADVVETEDNSWKTVRITNTHLSFEPTAQLS